MTRPKSRSLTSGEFRGVHRNTDGTIHNYAVACSIRAVMEQPHLFNVAFTLDSNNNIVSMDRDFLSGLTKLVKLDLSNNKLETLDEETFQDFNGTLILTSEFFWR